MTKDFFCITVSLRKNYPLLVAQCVLVSQNKKSICRWHYLSYFWRTAMFRNLNNFAAINNSIFTNENATPLNCGNLVKNCKRVHDVTLKNSMVDNANSWQTGLYYFIEAVQRFFEVRRLEQWRLLSIS